MVISKNQSVDATREQRPAWPFSYEIFIKLIFFILIQNIKGYALGGLALPHTSSHALPYSTIY